jgi:hypothetical protein
MSLFKKEMEDLVQEKVDNNIYNYELEQNGVNMIFNQSIQEIN